MFTKRTDGRFLKKLGPYDKALAYVMSSRVDAHVYFEDQIDCGFLDEYIAQKKDQGLEISYLHIIAAGCVRLYALRPALNRFVMNGRIFSRNGIFLSVAIKKRMRDEDASTVVKLQFCGKETIFEIKEILDDAIHKTKSAGDENDTDHLAAAVMNLPAMIVKPAVNLLKLLDRWNILPKAVISLSPFHTSFWITYMKSLGIPAIYHHLYNFGTSSMFLGLGKERRAPVIDEKTNEIKPGKLLDLRFVADERICDGMYNARSMRLLKKILLDPSVLELPVSELPVDPE